jgi:hypothetical protein
MTSAEVSGARRGARRAFGLLKRPARGADAARRRQLVSAEPFALLQIAPTSDEHAIDAAYWRRARELAAAQSSDPAAVSELEQLNEAYHGLLGGGLRHQSREPRGLPVRRIFTAASLIVIVMSGAVAALSYRSEIADLGSASASRASQVTADAADWLRSFNAPQTPTAHFVVVANTGGQGAFIRIWPSYQAQGIVALPDGTGLVATGEEVKVGGESWAHVRDAQGRDGWISRRWLSPAGQP